MLGDGIVSFGTCAGEAASARKRNASAKIGSGREIRSATCAADGVNSMSPSSERNGGVTLVIWPSPPDQLVEVRLLLDQPVLLAELRELLDGVLVQVRLPA